MKELTSCIGAVVLFAVTLVVGAVLNGWVLTILWAWFVVPTFRLPSLAIPAAIGLAIVARVRLDRPPVHGAGVRQAVGLSRAELTDIECAANSGISADLGTTWRLLATVRELQREIVVQGERATDEIDRLLRRTAESVEGGRS